MGGDRSRSTSCFCRKRGRYFSVSYRTPSKGLKRITPRAIARRINRLSQWRYWFVVDAA